MLILRLALVTELLTIGLAFAAGLRGTWRFRRVVCATSATPLSILQYPIHPANRQHPQHHH